MVSRQTAAFTQRKSEKTVKTHCIASALSARFALWRPQPSALHTPPSALGIDWRLARIAHGLCQFPRRREIKLPPRRRQRQWQHARANRNWPNELECPRYGHKQSWMSRRRRRSRQRSCNHLHANELCKLNNSELAAKCKLRTIWPNKLCNFIYKHRFRYIYI